MGSTGEKVWTEEEVAELMKQASDYVDHKLAEQQERHERTIDRLMEEVNRMTGELRDIREQASG